MKKTKKVFAIGLSFVSCVSVISSTSVNAAVWTIDGPNAPDGYVQFEDGGYYQDAANEWYDPPMPITVPYVPYEHSETGDIILAKNHMFNYVQFLVTEENADAFEQIYAAYAGALDFDEETQDELTSGKIYYTYYDNKNADGEESCDPADFENKYDVILELTQELEAADLLLEARYHSCMATGLQVDSTVNVVGLTEENIDIVSEIVAGYGGMVVSIEAGSTYEYAITGVTTFETKMTMKEAVEAQVSDVTVLLSTMVFEGTGVTLLSDEIDLLAAEPDPEPTPDPEPPVATPTTDPDSTTAEHQTGDLDGDGAITIQDAYQTLMAYANASAGLEDGLSEAQRKAVDVDGDGAVTIQDAYKILCYYADASAGLEPSWA